MSATGSVNLIVLLLLITRSLRHGGFFAEEPAVTHCASGAEAPVHFASSAATTKLAL
jgi:hypothetical protein